MKQKKQLLMVLAILTVTMSWAQKTIVTEGWDGATSKEVWSDKAVTWSIDWVTRYSDNTVERTPFIMSAPRGLRALTEWNLPYIAFGWEDYPLEFSDPQMSIVSSTNESRTYNGAVFSWVNEKREITDRMTIHSWFDNKEVTSFLKEVLDKNRNWENKWEALDPFNCIVSYKNHDYLFGQKYPKTVEVSRRSSTTYYSKPYYSDWEGGIISDVLSYNVGEYTLEAPAIIRSEGIGKHEVNGYGSWMPEEWGWLYDVKQTVANNSKQNGFVYVWSLHFAQGTLLVPVPSGSSPEWNFEYFEYGASPLCNSGVYHDGTWMNAIASDDVDMMRWREAGPIMDSQDFDEAKQMNWNDGHGVSAITNRFDIELKNTMLIITDTYEDRIIDAQSYDFFKEEWGKLVDVKQSLAKSDIKDHYVYVLSLHFSNGYVLPAIITSGITGPIWNLDLCEKTPNGSYNSAYYDKTEHVWKNAIAYDYGSKMYWAREGAVLASKKYDVAESQNWDEGHGTSVHTNRYDMKLYNDHFLVTDSYTDTNLGFWSYTPRWIYDTEYRDNTRTPQAFSAYLEVGKNGKVVWNSQEISNADTEENNGKQLTSEECKVPIRQFQIVPDEGFELDSVSLDNLNVTSYVAYNVLTLRTIPRDIHLGFRFVKKDYTPIVFADPKTEAICLANWDLDGNGVLNRGEAASVESIGTIFKNSEITSFEELQYFTGLTSIEKAFSGCKSLSKVTIPKTVTSIGGTAFSNCSSLSSITIPDGVTEIGSTAFWECSSLTSVTLPQNVKEIGRYAFYKCSNLESVELPEGLTTIGELAFENCTSLASVTIPNSVTTINRGAFSNSGLTSITFLGSVTTLGPNVFYQCGSLTSVTSYAEEPASFYSSDNVFTSETLKNATLYVPAGKKSKYKSTYGWSSFTNIVEMEALTDGDSFTADMSGTIGIFVVTGSKTANLKKCGNVSRVEVPSTITYNGVEYTITGILGTATGDANQPNQPVFGSNVTEVVIPNTVESIGACAFWYCENLTSVTIPNSVTSIGDNAFLGSGLTSVIIPAGVTSIGEWAFTSCYSLTKVVAMDDTPVNISGNPRFSDNILQSATLYVPSGKTTAYKNAGWNFTNIVELSALNDGDTFEATVGETTFKVKVLSAADKTCQIGADSRGDAIVSGGGKSWDGVIPAKVTGSDYQEYTVIGIGNRAFWEYGGSFKSLKLPETLLQTSEGVFMRCENLMYVTIPAGLKTIGGLLFNGQESLTEVVSLIEDPNAVSGSPDCGGRYGNKATLVVPAGKKSVYQNAQGWNSFPRIVEMKKGDADGNAGVDQEDVEIAKDFIMSSQKPDGFVRQNADTNGDNDVNAVDIVNIVNVIKNTNNGGNGVKPDVENENLTDPLVSDEE